MTAERGDGRYTRNGLEEHVSDCVILLDLPMPRLEGRQLLRAVKQDPRTRDIPVVAATSNG